VVGRPSLQLRVLRLGFFQDRNVGVGVFPEGKEFLAGERPDAGGVGIRSLRVLRLQGMRTSHTEMCQGSCPAVPDDAAVIDDLLELGRCRTALSGCKVCLPSYIRRTKAGHRLGRTPRQLRPRRPDSWEQASKPWLLTAGLLWDCRKPLVARRHWFAISRQFPCCQPVWQSPRPVRSVGLPWPDDRRRPRCRLPEPVQCSLRVCPQLLLFPQRSGVRPKKGKSVESIVEDESI
jgi:hypothetical protein